MKPISFILDITPIIGGFKMLGEAMKGKEMTGAILVGNARSMHFGFGIVTLILDGFTFGTGGTVTRLTFKIFRKGFLRRGAVLGAKAAGKGATRTALRESGRVLGKMGETRIGRMAINSSERKIRKGAEHALGNVHGYRFDDKKRDELRKKMGVNINNNNDLKNASTQISGGDEVKDIKNSSRFFQAAMNKSKKFVKNRYGYNLENHKQSAIGE